MWIDFEVKLIIFQYIIIRGFKRNY